MLNRRMRTILVTLAMSLAIMSLTSGCSILKKQDTTETEPQTQTETETESEPQTESETQTETELKTDVAYTSQDKTIRITLPDSTWKVTQDADEMRVFSSGSDAMINIVHAQSAAEMKNLSVADSEETLKTTLAKKYPETNAFEVVEFEKLSSTSLDTYEYVVKYNSTSMWAYSITYGILADNEAYVITGTVTDDNKVLMEAVKKSVESFTVLRNSSFNAIPGTVVNQSESESQEQSETQADAAAELQSLTDYGTTATLYVNGDIVNIRQQPSTEGNLLGTLQQGASVTVVGETSQWFKVNVNGNIGYISKALLVSTPTTTQTETSASNSQNISDSTIVSAELNSYVDYGTSYTYYTTTDVNLRSQPVTESDNVISGLGGGAAVSVIGETENWFVVSVNGTTGYVSKSYLSSTNTSGTTGDTGSTGGSSSTGGSTSSTPSGGTGVVSGTIQSMSMSSIVVLGDDGKTYTIDYSDASVSSADGLYEGVYVTATVDYGNTLSGGELYATSVSGN